MTEWSQHGFKNSLKSPKISKQTSKNRRLGVVLGGLGASGEVLGRLGVSWGRLRGVLELSWGRLGGVLGHLGAVLGASWGVFGASGGVLGAS